MHANDDGKGRHEQSWKTASSVGRTKLTRFDLFPPFFEKFGQRDSSRFDGSLLNIKGDFSRHKSTIFYVH